MWRYGGVFGIIGDALRILFWPLRRFSCVLTGHDGRYQCKMTGATWERWDPICHFSTTCGHEKRERCTTCGVTRIFKGYSK